MESFRGGYLFDAMSAPESIGAAKGRKAAFSADASTRQHEHAVLRCQRLGHCPACVPVAGHYASLEVLVEQYDRSMAPDDAAMCPTWLHNPTAFLYTEWFGRHRLSGPRTGGRIRPGRQGIYNLYIRYAKAEATGRGSPAREFVILVHPNDIEPDHQR
jgi:hypothetical protein